MSDPRKLASPFRYISSSPEVIRLVATMCVRFTLSLRNGEAVLFERGVGIGCEGDQVKPTARHCQ
jgi:putative transposase